MGRGHYSGVEWSDESKSCTEKCKRDSIEVSSGSAQPIAARGVSTHEYAGEVGL